MSAKPSDELNSLLRDTEARQRQQELNQQIAAENERLLAEEKARRDRLMQAVGSALSFPDEERAAGRKPSPDGFAEWAKRFVEIGKRLTECDDADPELRIRARLRSVSEKSIPALMKSACTILNMCSEEPLELAIALEKLHRDPWLRNFLAWLSFIFDRLWCAPSDTGCTVMVAEPPEGTTPEEAEQAERAFTWHPKNAAVVKFNLELRKLTSQSPNWPDNPFGQLLELGYRTINEELAKSSRVALAARRDDVEIWYPKATARISECRKLADRCLASWNSTGLAYAEVERRVNFFFAAIEKITFWQRDAPIKSDEEIESAASGITESAVVAYLRETFQSLDRAAELVRPLSLFASDPATVPVKPMTTESYDIGAVIEIEQQRQEERAKAEAVRDANLAAREASWQKLESLAVAFVNSLLTGPNESLDDLLIDPKRVAHVADTMIAFAKAAIAEGYGTWFDDRNNENEIRFALAMYRLAKDGERERLMETLRSLSTMQMRSVVIMHIRERPGEMRHSPKVLDPYPVTSPISGISNAEQNPESVARETFVDVSIEESADFTPLEEGCRYAWRFIPPDHRSLGIIWSDNSGNDIWCRVDTPHGIIFDNYHRVPWCHRHWTIDAQPMSCTLPAIESWFDYAIRIACKPLKDVNPDDELGPNSYPSALCLVRHAMLIVERVGLDIPWPEVGVIGRLGALQQILSHIRVAFSQASNEADNLNDCPIQISVAAQEPATADIEPNDISNPEPAPKDEVPATPPIPKRFLFSDYALGYRMPSFVICLISNGKWREKEVLKLREGLETAFVRALFDSKEGFIGRQELIALALNRTERDLAYVPEDAKIKVWNTIKTTMSNVRNALQTAIGTEKDPMPFVKTASGYKLEIKINPDDLSDR